MDTDLLRAIRTIQRSGQTEEVIHMLMRDIRDKKVLSRLRELSGHLLARLPSNGVVFLESMKDDFIARKAYNYVTHTYGQTGRRYYLEAWLRRLPSLYINAKGLQAIKRLCPPSMLPPLTSIKIKSPPLCDENPEPNNEAPPW